MERPPDSPRLPDARRRPTRPPRLRSFPVLPRGKRLYKLDPGHQKSGPGEPPPGFVTPTTSASEWRIYWALAKVLKFPKDPRQGPFTGWPGLWSFQWDIEGGRSRRGGQVVDFIISPVVTGHGELGIRLATDKYHLFTDYRKHAVDRILLTRLARFFRVVDIYEQDIIKDDNGQSAVLEVKRAIFGGKSSDPLSANTAVRVRY